MLSKRLLSCADLDGSSEFQASRFKGEDSKPMSDRAYV